ncbi:MAG: CynX/NimT family MFS transporter [Ilumatobacteraceae bacterium]
MTDDEAPVDRSERVWLMIAVVMASTCIAQAFGRFTWGVVLPGARDDLLGGSNTMAGFFGTVNVTAYLLGTLFVSWASSRISLVGMVRLGVSTSTVSLGVASFATSGPVLALALFGMGLGGAVIWIPSPKIAARSFAPERAGVAVGLVGSGIGIGIVFAGQIASLLGRTREATEVWQLVYRIEFGIAVAVLIGTILVLRSKGERPSVGGGLGGFGALRNVRAWVPTSVAYSAFGFSYILVLAFLVARLKDDAGFSATQAALMFSLVGISAAFGGVSLGALSDRIGRRLTLTGSFTAFAFCGLIILTGQQPWVAIASVGAGLAFSGGPSLITAHIVANTDHDSYGPAFAAATLAFGVAQMVSPQIGGLIADTAGSFTWVFVLSAAVSMIGAAAASRLP